MMDNEVSETVVIETVGNDVMLTRRYNGIKCIDSFKIRMAAFISHYVSEYCDSRDHRINA